MHLQNDRGKKSTTTWNEMILWMKTAAVTECDKLYTEVGIARSLKCISSRIFEVKLQMSERYKNENIISTSAADVGWFEKESS